MLLYRLDRAHPHRGLGNIDEFHARQRFFELPAEVEVDMVELDADALSTRRQLAHGAVVIVPAPVRIGDVVAEAAAIGLATIDAGRNGVALSWSMTMPYLRPKCSRANQNSN